MMITVPAAGVAQIPMPSLPAATSPALRAAVDAYLAVHFGTEDGDSDQWDVLAWAISNHTPTSLADIIVKLLFALHYLHPGDGRDTPSIDLSAFDADAGRMLLRGVADLASLGGVEG